MSARELRDAQRAGAPPDARARYDRPGAVLLLWFGFLGGAIAWLLHLFIGYLLVGYACHFGLTFLIHIVSVVLLGVSLLSGWVSYRSWQDLGRSTEDEGEGVIGRSRWMALSGMVAGGWFAVVIVAQWIPVFMLPPCR
jgi:hypothetical protein